jgi:hypothetical protein
MDPSSLTKTNFSGKTVDNITDNELKKYILNDIKLKCGGIQYNSRYAKVYNEQYSRNLNNPHIICLKSSGTPYLLYCTQINNVNYSLLIDKKIKVGYEYPKMFVTPYKFDNSVFTGTLFETELVRDKHQNWFLLLGDIYFHKSNNCSNLVIMDRMNMIHRLLENEYNSDSFCDICPIQVKKYFDFKDKEDIMKEFIPQLDYGTRGFYFIPLKSSYSKILYLFKEGDLIVKKEKKDTVVCLIQNTMKRDVYDLYVQGPTNIVKHGIACIPTLRCSQMVRELFNEVDVSVDVYVECRFNDKFGKWEPLHKTTESISNIKDI